MGKINRGEFWTQAIVAIIAAAFGLLCAGEWAGFWNVFPERTDPHYDRG